MVAAWSPEYTPQMSPRRRLAWQEIIRRNRAWEQQLHEVYGVELALGIPSELCDVHSEAPTESRRSSRGGGNRSNASTPVGEVRSLRDDDSKLALRVRATSSSSSSWREILDRFPSLLRLYPLADASEIGWAEPQGEESAPSSRDEEMGAQVPCSLVRNMPPLAPQRVEPVPYRRVRPSYWLPSSRQHGGRYSNSPELPSRNMTKEELLQLSYVTLQSNDGRAMRVHTPDDPPNSTHAARFKPWIHAVARP